MPSPSTKDTQAPKGDQTPEGDQPAEQPSDSSKDAIEEPTANKAQNQALSAHETPVLDVSTVATRNNLDCFAELIRGINQEVSDGMEGSSS
ncbi:hypothetical protein CEP52_002868 [Fusarium oligoseptatum]|uniref:Uncharacterized protein n=1 Tax=Fusarium oligoseptatum TaxID=2604345 RepID=A0A428UBQ5_9HYPO|nr:hypothetical protein CEP52_002868 [Fusarium oligoseptatum]